MELIYNIIPHHHFVPYKSTQLLPLLFFLDFVQMKNKSFLRIFSKIYKYVKTLTKISGNWTENTFESSLFHTFQQQ